jgi:hypothetical protein
MIQEDRDENQSSISSLEDALDGHSEVEESSMSRGADMEYNSMVVRERKSYADPYYTEHMSYLGLNRPRNNDIYTRLYKNGLEQDRKLARRRKEKLEAESQYEAPKLEIYTRSYTPKKSRNDEPVHDRLYHLSVNSSTSNEGEDDERQQNKFVNLTPSREDERVIGRLYGRSSNLAQQGKERRKQIEKSLAPKPPTPSRKLDRSMSTNMYEKGMEFQYHRDQRLNDSKTSPSPPPREEWKKLPGSKMRSGTPSRYRNPTPSRSRTPPSSQNTRHSETPNRAKPRSPTPSSGGGRRINENRSQNVRRARSQTPNRNRARSETPQRSNSRDTRSQAASTSKKVVRRGSSRLIPQSTQNYEPKKASFADWVKSLDDGSSKSKKGKRPEMKSNSMTLPLPTPGVVEGEMTRETETSEERNNYP